MIWYDVKDMMTDDMMRHRPGIVKLLYHLYVINYHFFSK
jgi:hypothetical protein